MAKRRVQAGESYAGRRADATVVNVTMDAAAATLLRQYAGGKKLGAFMAKLVYEYDVRQAERARLREQIAQVLGRE
jgi:hypothetical protein